MHPRRLAFDKRLFVVVAFGFLFEPFEHCERLFLLHRFKVSVIRVKALAALKLLAYVIIELRWSFLAGRTSR
jgi:hypothetical protein